MKFGIDLDGVVGNFGGRVIEAANILWPGRLPLDYVPNNWDYTDVFTKEDWKMIWQQIKSTPFFWIDEQPLPGLEELQDFLNRPAHKNDQVFFITARAETIGMSALQQSCIWLQKYGLYPRLGLSVVLPVSDPQFKKELFRGLKVQSMLDDYAPTIEGLNQIKDDDGKQFMRAYILDQPWNRYMKDQPRVHSVTEYLETINAPDPAKIQLVQLT